MFGLIESKMKKTGIQVLFLATIFILSSCGFTQTCPTYAWGNKKAKIKASERSQKHMAKKVYTPGRFYH
jgi:hypothetical protein